SSGSGREQADANGWRISQEPSPLIRVVPVAGTSFETPGRGTMSKRQRLFSKRKIIHRATSPGTLIEPEGARPPVIDIIAFDAERVVERSAVSVDDAAALAGQFPVVWIDVAGLGDAELIRRLGETFDLHPLALEDVLNTHHRPKVEEYDNNAFVVTRMASIERDRLAMEQGSPFLGEHLLVWFQEKTGACST